MMKKGKRGVPRAKTTFVSIPPPKNDPYPYPRCTACGLRSYGVEKEKHTGKVLRVISCRETCPYAKKN